MPHPMQEAPQPARPPAPSYEGFAEPAFADVAKCFDKLFGAPRGGGGALVVRWRGRTVVDVWKGFSDREGTRPWTRDTMAISFSTTKGVASTVIHRLADRGLIDYDRPVATYWPEFAAGGKKRITVRQLLSHQAGLHSVKAVATDADAILDHIAMEKRLALRLPDGGPGRPAYHALTYGWLVAGLARRVTGKGMAELVRTEIAEPLGLDGGLSIGAPPDGLARVAAPVGARQRLVWMAGRLLTPVGGRFAFTRRAAEALYVPGFETLLDGAEPRLLQTEMPAANGVFSAHALATMYAALADAGRGDGAQLVSRDTVLELGRVQTRERDGVLGWPMRWRLGYHQAIAIGAQAGKAFGHFGYGGSGAWADPVSGLSFAFVTNKLGTLTTPMGDLGLFRLSGLALAAVQRSRPRTR
jgi:CubicO group peptidase (beta-lactamase class C family)